MKKKFTLSTNGIKNYGKWETHIADKVTFLDRETTVECIPRKKQRCEMRNAQENTSCEDQPQNRDGKHHGVYMNCQPDGNLNYKINGTYFGAAIFCSPDSKQKMCQLYSPAYWQYPNIIRLARK